MIFSFFSKKKVCGGGVNLIFGEKVAVSEGTFGAKKIRILIVILKKKWSIIGANDKNPLEDGCFLGGGAFWRIGGGGLFGELSYFICSKKALFEWVRRAIGRYKCTIES